MKEVDQNFICQSNDSLISTMKKIDLNECGACVVIENGKLFGIVSDGDIRRYLINGGHLNGKVGVIARRNCTFLTAETRQEYLKYLNNKIRVVPIINEQFYVEDVIGIKNPKIQVLAPYLYGNESKYVNECFENNWISSQGQFVDKFENEFSKLHNGRKCLTTSNGTTALHLALMSAGVTEGDEIITTNLSFAATINSIIYCSATPVLCDIDEKTMCLSAEDARKKITNKTKAILIVHLYGQSCDTLALQKLAKEHEILLIEDCAESLGTKYMGCYSGTFGDIATYSFFGNKTITTGEGGMVSFKADNYYSRARKLRDHGMSNKKRYYHDVVGYNYRLTNIQAAIGCAQLEKLDTILELKRNIMRIYNDFFKDKTYFTQLPFNNEDSEHSNWLYTPRLKDFELRDEFIRFLTLNKIESRPGFVPFSQMEIYKKYVGNSSLCVSEKISRELISLPSHPSLDKDDLKRVVDIVDQFFK